MDRAVAELRAALAPDRVLTGAAERILYSRDASAVDGVLPGVVCLPLDTDEVRSCVAIARAHGLSVTPRGSGTGLAGGAVPDAQTVLIVTSRMRDVLEIDPEARVAWVQPGVLNLDLSKATAPHGLHYAPDPSSQQSCSVGGNVGTNAGGPHCLAQGVTSAHVLAMEVVLPDATVTMLGGLEADVPGYDLRGAFVGSEGTMGIATRIAVRLVPDPPAVRTLLADFTTIRAACEAVSAVIASGVLPAALEMMDANCIRAVESWAHAGLPLDAGAVLLVEVDGLEQGVVASATRISEICRTHGARTVRVAADAAERATLWKARKSAFGAVANIAPNYELHDTVVPRKRLAEVMDRIGEIAEELQLVVLNVFHAGDGNLHPLLVFDRRDPGVVDRVHEAGRRIIEACVEVGGMLSGEHGIGVEKRDYMSLVFDAVDLEHQCLVRDVFDPTGSWNPGKVMPRGSHCGEIAGIGAEGLWV